MRGGGLTQGAVGAPSSKITDTPNLLVGIPRSRVYARVVLCDLRESEADSSVAAQVWADGSLAGDAVVVREADALTCASVAKTLI